MYYIKSDSNSIKNYGNPMRQPFPDCIEMPDKLLSSYFEYNGFQSEIYNITK